MIWAPIQYDAIYSVAHTDAALATGRVHPVGVYDDCPADIRVLMGFMAILLLSSFLAFYLRGFRLLVFPAARVPVLKR